MVIEKYQPSKIWTAVLYDADQKYYYIKRFLLEVNTRKQNFLGENPKNRLMLLTDEVYPRIEVIFRRPRRLPGSSHPRCRRIYRGERLQSQR